MITELTKEQEALKRDYADKWVKIAFCKEPADRELAEIGIEKIYAYKGLEKPIIKWYSNPYEMILNAAKAYMIYQRKIKNEEIKKYLQVKENYIELIESVLSQDLNVNKKLKKQASELKDKHLSYGQHDADWLADYDYLREVLSLEEETKSLHGFFDVAKSAGWFMPFDRYCFISERPCEVHVDEENRLHNENGPALRYPPSKMFPDGFQMNVIHGVKQ